MEETQEIIRDYSLIGLETKKAIDAGLAEAEWYQTPVPREKMRELLVRKNGPAIRDTAIWFALIFGSGYLTFLLWGTWWFILPYMVYSVIYASTSDSRWHESGHGTAFKTDWMNNLLYKIASFMVFRQSTAWRWSHARHHSDTIIRGRDPEISVPRPPNMLKIVRGFFGLGGSISEVRRLFRHAGGKIDPEVATYVPVADHKKIFWEARIYLLIYLVVIGLAVYFNTLLPVLYIGIPTIVGSWLLQLYGLTQHAGLQENVLDHRLNSRTVYMNRVHRYLYWNMNYHVEHHMFPLVPYHALPRLHELVKYDCPKPYNGILEVYREMIPALMKQRKDPYYFVRRELPDRAGRQSERKERMITGDPAMMVDGRIKVCHTDELPKSEVIRFDFNQRTYAIYRTDENRFYATDGICSHSNAHLAEGVLIGGLIECPKHNGRFSIKDGLPKRIPACVAINTYNVSLEHDIIYLEVSGKKKAHISDANQEKQFRVVSNHNVAAFIKELVLEPLGQKEFTFKPGEYIQLMIPPFEMTFEEIVIDDPFQKIWQDLGLFDCFSRNTIHTKRNFSMANNPGNESLLRFNVRISLPPGDRNISAGIGTSYVFNLKPGDEVRLTGPFGDFYIKDSQREMIYLGGGAGMAPLRSHLSYLFETVKTSRKVSFWYGARTPEDLFYDEYFSELEKNNENFTFHVAYSEPGKHNSRHGSSGFIHEVLLKDYLEDHQHPAEIEYYLCGPPALIEAGTRMLARLGVPEKMISFDEF